MGHNIQQRFNKGLCQVHTGDAAAQCWQPHPCDDSFRVHMSYEYFIEIDWKTSGLVYYSGD